MRRIGIEFISNLFTGFSSSDRSFLSIDSTCIPRLLWQTRLLSVSNVYVSRSRDTLVPRIHQISTISPSGFLAQESCELNRDGNRLTRESGLLSRDLMSSFKSTKPCSESVRFNCSRKALLAFFKSCSQSNNSCSLFGCRRFANKGEMRGLRYKISLTQLCTWIWKGPFA